MKYRELSSGIVVNVRDGRALGCCDVEYPDGQIVPLRYERFEGRFTVEPEPIDPKDADNAALRALLKEAGDEIQECHRMMATELGIVYEDQPIDPLLARIRAATEAPSSSEEESK
jgi:hypothetical protein